MKTTYLTVLGFLFLILALLNLYAQDTIRYYSCIILANLYYLSVIIIEEIRRK